MSYEMGTGGQPAGWYYAEGDPPGTQRYWDGAQWQGGPQIVGGAAANVTGFAAPTLAEPGERFIAFLIDFLILFAIGFVAQIAQAIAGAGSSTVGEVVSLVFSLAAIAFGLYNWMYLQGTTGQTIGKKQQGIALRRHNTREPVGIGMAFLRIILHMVLWMLCLFPLIIDHIMVLVSSDHRRFSDSIMGMHVYRDNQ